MTHKGSHFLTEPVPYWGRIPCGLYSGSTVDLQTIGADDVDINQIAHSLSRICRFGGHIEMEHYSVAQHSVLVSDILWQWGFEDLRLSGLMHDAAECYVGDIKKPLGSLVPKIKSLEHSINKVLASKYGLIYPWPKPVLQADMAAYAVERREVCKNPGEWEDDDDYPDIVPWVKIYELSPNASKGLFLHYFNELHQ